MLPQFICPGGLGLSQFSNGQSSRSPLPSEKLFRVRQMIAPPAMRDLPNHLASEIEFHFVAGRWHERPARLKSSSRLPTSTTFPILPVRSVFDGGPPRSEYSAARIGAPASAKYSLGPLDDGLGAAGEPWLQPRDLTEDFQRGQPVIGGGGQFQRPPPNQPCSAGLQSGGRRRSKFPRLALLGQRAHVTLKVGGQIRVVEGYNVDVRVSMHFRESPSDD